ncbi:MAG: hypothetical protein H6638_12560 [Ardenticatenales bacterium]|nr:hypothetical protein [Ardenticatenales bacterium]
MARFRLLIGLLILIVASTATGHAQGPITASSSADLLPELPRRLLFAVGASSNAGDITDAKVYFQPRGSSVRISETVAVNPAPTVTLSHEWNMQQNGTPPGTVIDYFWRLTDSAGNQFDTPEQSIVALDPRFEWQTLEDEELAIHWYRGDQSWGQAMFDTGKEALAQLESELGADITKQVTLVDYASDRDFSAAFPLQQDWIGGQAFTDLGVTVQIIAPGDRSWMRTVIFHELSHLVMAQATEGAVALVPSWLEEGLAMYNEPESRDSASRVARAAEDGTLLPYSHLQGNFGADGAVVGIAYAQSEMMVSYLIDDCGQAGFRAMIDNLVEESMSVDGALEAACGYDGRTLYNNWRQTLPNAPALDDTAPNTDDTAQSADEQATPVAAQAPTTPRSGMSAVVRLGILASLCALLVAGVGILFVGYRLVSSRS